MTCSSIYDVCKLDVLALAGAVLLPLALTLGMAYSSLRHTPPASTFALESLPLLAGSTAGLLLLVSSQPLVPAQHTASVILAVGALAIIPLLISRSRAGALMNPKPRSRKHKRKSTVKLDMPKLKLEEYDDASSSTATSPTAFSPSLPVSDEDEKGTRKSQLDVDTSIRSPIPTAPGTPADIDHHHIHFPSDEDQVPIGLADLASPGSDDFLRCEPPRGAFAPPTDSMAPDSLALEDEFVRILLRSAARAGKTGKSCSFGVWNEDWPVYWEGAGLAAKGCW